MSDKTSEIAATLGVGARRRATRTWVTLAVVAAASAGLAWYIIERAGESKAIRYTSAEATVESFAVSVSATGTVEPTNLVEISSELSGTLKSVEVDFNDEVEVGTVMARLDTTKIEAQVAIAKASLDSAIAHVAIAEASLEDAQERFQSTSDLYDRGFTPHQDYITAKAAFIRAQAEHQSAVADRSLAEANLDLYTSDLEKTCICSPIKGVVLDRSVDPGQIVAASLSAPVLFTVAEDLTKMQVQVDIDEADIGRVAVGNPAEFTVDAYDGRRFPAEISEVRFAPETIEGVVTYKAILTVDNSEMLLRPGMTATADIIVAKVNDALVVPNAAMRYSPPRDTSKNDDQRSGLLGMLMPERPGEEAKGDDKTIWVLKEGAASEIPVRAGDTDGDVTQILDGPLAVGDLVITGQSDE